MPRARLGQRPASLATGTRQPWAAADRPIEAASGRPHVADARPAPGAARARRPSRCRPPGPPSAAFRRGHHAGAGPRHRRRRHRLHDRRRRRAATAAVRRPERLVTIWDTNVEKAATHDPISPVNFMDVRALPVFEDAAAWWRPGINLVDPGLEPARAATIEVSGNLFALLGVKPQVGAGFPEDGPIFAPARARRRDQRPAVAHPLRRGSRRRRPPVAAQRRTLHSRRRDAARLPLPGRRRRLAAAAMGHDPAQPRRPLHGSRRADEARRRHRRGPGRGQHPHRALPDRVRPDQSRLGHAAGAAARRDARLLPPGAVGAARRGRRPAGDRLHQRRLAAAHPRPVARARSGGAGRARGHAAPAPGAAHGRERSSWPPAAPSSAWRSPPRRCRYCCTTRRSRFLAWPRPRWMSAP